MGEKKKTKKKAKKENIDQENKNVDKKKKNKKKKKHPKLRLLLKIILILIVIGIVSGAGVLAAIIHRCVYGDWAISEEALSISYLNSTIYDKNGNVLGTLSGDENRQIISKEEMSPYLFDAFISIEDERFEEHNGVDWKRTLGAIVTFVTHKGESSYGGSTITQQVIKNSTGEKENSKIEGALRKIKEIVRAYEVEKMLSKDQILELYLNLIPLGGTAYGVETASINYFNKSAKDLSLVESAYLAGITHAPSTYNPFGEKDRSENIKKRVKTVLGKMNELGKIDDEEYEKAIEEVNNGIKFEKGYATQINSLTYHTEAAIKQLIEDLMEANNWSKGEAELHVYGSGYQIYTTFDPEIQKAVDEQYITKSKNWTTSYKTVTRKDSDGTPVKVQVRRESAMVIIDHKTGQVLAGTSGFGEKTEAWGRNRMIYDIHSPGSSIKPIAVIGPSLEEKLITAATVVDDTPVSFGTYRPQNDTRNFNGLMNIRWILRVSRNVPEVKMMQRLTVARSLEYLDKFGLDISSEHNDGLGLALGGMSKGPTVLQMAAAYAAIANNGTYIEPTFYTKVVNAEGTVIECEQKTERVISEQNAYILKTLLQEPTGSGLTGAGGATGTGAKVSKMATSGKTGTTDDSKAVWFCGFTPYYAAAVWMGYDYENEGNAGGSGTAARLWGAVMTKAHTGLPSITQYERPSGIRTAVVCSKSGLLAKEECKNDPTGSKAYTEYFVEGTVPGAYCDCHVQEEVCSVSGKLPGEHCTERVQTVFITRKNSENDTSWQSAADADSMLPTEICDVCGEGEDPNEQEPTEEPTVSPQETVSPTAPPTKEPSKEPTVAPTVEPTTAPTTSGEE